MLAHSLLNHQLRFVPEANNLSCSFKAVLSTFHLPGLSRVAGLLVDYIFN